MAKWNHRTRHAAVFVPSPFEPQIGIPLVFIFLFLLATVVISRAPQISEAELAGLHEALAANP